MWPWQGLLIPLITDNVSAILVTMAFSKNMLHTFVLVPRSGKTFTFLCVIFHDLGHLLQNTKEVVGKLTLEGQALNKNFAIK